MPVYNPRKMMSLFYRNHPDKPKTNLIPSNTASPIVKLIAKTTEPVFKQKYGHLAMIQANKQAKN